MSQEMMPLNSQVAIQKDSRFSRISKRARYGAAVGVLTTSLIAACGKDVKSSQDTPVAFSEPTTQLVQTMFETPTPSVNNEVPAGNLALEPGEWRSTNFPFDYKLLDGWSGISTTDAERTKVDMFYGPEAEDGSQSKIMFYQKPANSWDTLDSLHQQWEDQFELDQAKSIGTGFMEQLLGQQAYEIQGKFYGGLLDPELEKAVRFTIKDGQVWIAILEHTKPVPQASEDDWAEFNAIQKQFNDMLLSIQPLQ